MGVEYHGNAPTGDGASLGQSATHKISLYGATPVVQRSSTALATSFLSASSNATIGSNIAAVFVEISNVLAGIGAMRTTA